MTAMATSAPSKPAPVGATRAAISERVAPVGRRVALVGACYLGMALIVALTVLAAHVLPAGVGLPVFMAAMIALVVLLHPTVRVTRRD